MMTGHYLLRNTILDLISSTHKWGDNGKTIKCEHEKLNGEDLKNKLGYILIVSFISR